MCTKCNIIFLHSVDASQEDGSLGRLVNDDGNFPNCKMKTVEVQGRPHLCLFALRDIMPGEELHYNYGNADWPWRVEVMLAKHLIPVSAENTLLRH